MSGAAMTEHAGFENQTVQSEKHETVTALARPLIHCTHKSESVEEKSPGPNSREMPAPESHMSNETIPWITP